MRTFLKKIYSNAVDLNHQNISSLFEEDPKARFLDLGCDDGVLSMAMACVIKTKKVFGVDLVDEQLKVAKKNGVIARKFDLNGKFNFKDDSFDVIHANQVIEHLTDSDIFLSEIYRILKPGGYAIISTENASSWCNIFASIMGWQIFSLTNFSSKKRAIGNPLALYRAEEKDLGSWKHVRIYNLHGLKEYFKIFDFRIEAVKGSGYFPFFAKLGDFDKTHCHFMTFKLRK